MNTTTLTCALLFMALLSACQSEKNTAQTLSAGATLKPNVNYSVSDQSTSDYEPPHNTRIAHPYHELVPTLSPQIPVQLRPHSRLFISDIEDRPFFDYFEIGRASCRERV